MRSGKYWPDRIDSIRDELTYEFLERNIYLLRSPHATPPLACWQTQRHEAQASDDPLLTRLAQLSREGARALADAADGCWTAIKARDVTAFGRYTRLAYEAQVRPCACVRACV